MRRQQQQQRVSSEVRVLTPDRSLSASSYRLNRLFTLTGSELIRHERLPAIVEDRRKPNQRELALCARHEQATEHVAIQKERGRRKIRAAHILASLYMIMESIWSLHSAHAGKNDRIE